MKLYCPPGSCALAPLIAAREAGIDVAPVAISFLPDGTRMGADGRDLARLNAKGKVPVLEVGDMLLTETQAILQYLASLAPLALPIPEDGAGRFRLLEALSFVATEIHKSFALFFSPSLTPEGRAEAEALIGRWFQIVDGTLASRPYFAGERFTIVDAYLFTVASWSPRHRIDLTPWPHLRAYLARIAERPAVRRAMSEEASLS